EAGAMMQVQAQQKDDFIRIIFPQESPESFEVTATPDALTVRFSAPVKPNLNEAEAALTSLVSSTQVSKDLKSITFNFAQKQPLVRTRKFIGSSFVGVDLLDVSLAPKQVAAAPPPAAKKEPAPAAPVKPAV